MMHTQDSIVSSPHYGHNIKYISNKGTIHEAYVIPNQATHVPTELLPLHMETY